MFDYKIWIQKAVSFTEKLTKLKPFFDEVSIEIIVKPSLSESETLEIVSNTNKFTPSELIKFWHTGSANCNCDYTLSIPKAEISLSINEILGLQSSLYGGAAFIPATKLPEKIIEIEEWAMETWISEYPNEQRFWLNSVPFIEIQNGDYIALDITERKNNPQVIYLSHDDESFVISESFTNFLTNWEDLCYIGPASWLLENFQNEKGFISADSERAEKLKRLFNVE